MAEINYRDMNESKKVIGAFAHQVLRRLHGLGARSHSIEDVEQELWIAWCAACESFDPSRGVKFTSYLTNGMRMHINRYVERHFERFHEQTTALSLDYSDNGDGEGEGECPSFSDIVADGAETADIIVDRERNFAYAMQRLSPRAQQFLTFLKEQPVEILEEVRRLEQKAEHAKKAGLNYATPHRLAAYIVFDFMGASRFERKQILDEVTTLGEAISG